MIKVPTVIKKENTERKDCPPRSSVNSTPDHRPSTPNIYQTIRSQGQEPGPQDCHCPRWLDPQRPGPFPRYLPQPGSMMAFPLAATCLARTYEVANSLQEYLRDILRVMTRVPACVIEPSLSTVCVLGCTRGGRGGV